MVFRYNDIKSGGGEFNYEFWGQECGPVHDEAFGNVHKYMEDAISVNTGNFDFLKNQVISHVG